MDLNYQENENNIYIELNSEMRTDTVSPITYRRASSRTNSIVDAPSEMCEINVDNRILSPSNDKDQVGVFDFEDFQNQCAEGENECEGEGLEEYYCYEDEIYAYKYSEYLKCTVKQLFLICEFYKILKFIQTNKLKKEEIIEQIIWFEDEPNNFEAVQSRMKYWKTLQDMSSHPVLKKFICAWKYNASC